MAFFNTTDMTCSPNIDSHQCWFPTGVDPQSDKFFTITRKWIQIKSDERLHRMIYHWTITVYHKMQESFKKWDQGNSVIRCTSRYKYSFTIKEFWNKRKGETLFQGPFLYVDGTQFFPSFESFYYMMPGPGNVEVEYRLKDGRMELVYGKGEEHFTFFRPPSLETCCRLRSKLVRILLYEVLQVLGNVHEDNPVFWPFYNPHLYDEDLRNEEDKEALSGKTPCKMDHGAYPAFVSVVRQVVRMMAELNFGAYKKLYPKLSKVEVFQADFQGKNCNHNDFFNFIYGIKSVAYLCPECINSMIDNKY